MAYTMTAAVVLGAANSGLTLTADLRNADGTSAAGLTTTNLLEVAGGSGSYTWTGTIPDNHRGYINFLDGATFKAQVPVDPAEIERVDVKTSTRSSHSAADVWAVGTRELTGFGTLVADTATAVWAAGTRTLTSFGTLVADIWASGTRTLTSFGTLTTDTATAVWAAGTRTLTSFGTLAADTATAVWAAGTRTLSGFGSLVADIWSHATRTLTSSSGGATAAEVWSYATRTLTTAITAVSPPPVITGETVSVIRGDSWSLPFTGLGDVTGNTKLWLTVKAEYDDDDDESIVQVERTVGLVRLNGAAATAGEGSVTVIDAGEGDITFAVDEAATVEVPAGRYYYDVQSLVSGTVRTHTSGRFSVVNHVTHSIA